MIARVPHVAVRPNGVSFYLAEVAPPRSVSALAACDLVLRVLPGTEYPISSRSHAMCKRDYQGTLVVCRPPAAVFGELQHLWGFTIVWITA